MQAANRQQAPARLTPWQKAQAAMLYAFAAPDYLVPLRDMLQWLMRGDVRPLLALAHRLPIAPRLVRAVENHLVVSGAWSTHARARFGDIERALQAKLSPGQQRRHAPLAPGNLLAAIEDGPYSDRVPYRYPTDSWASTIEKRLICLAHDVIRQYGGRYDDTVDQSCNRWDDFAFAFAFPAFAAEWAHVPRLAVNLDV